MNRRTFIKFITASAGLKAVPSFADLSAYEPDRWIVRTMNYDRQMGVAAAWGNLRYAVRFWIDPRWDDSNPIQKRMIEDAKNVLRAWYRDYGRSDRRH
jgi:hypothetical protein